MLKMTALHWAAQHGHHGVAETLIKHGADVHALSKFDKTPFDIAVDIQNTELMLLLQVSACRTSLCMISTYLHLTYCYYYPSTQIKPFIKVAWISVTSSVDLAFLLCLCEYRKACRTRWTWTRWTWTRWVWMWKLAPPPTSHSSSSREYPPYRGEWSTWPTCSTRPMQVQMLKHSCCSF